MVSDVRNKEKLNNMGFKYYFNLQEAVDRAMDIKGINARVTILPYAPCVIPDQKLFMTYTKWNIKMMLFVVIYT